MNRAYISFSYGGKYIEDFNLLATMGDRLSKNVYANFEDATSEYDTLDGQYFWGTHFTTNQLEFTLSTDGMSQTDLEKFKMWFKPGVERELILAEHPNRVIMARVATPPSISMIPFEQIESIRVNGALKDIPTALYRGDITLSFVMDGPYWHGRLFYMPKYLDLSTFDGQENSEAITDENDPSTILVPAKTESMVDTIENKDTLKMCLEDNLPYGQYLPDCTFFGNDHYMTKDEGGAIVGISKLPARLGILNIDSKTGAIIGNNEDNWYVFYSGTAPSKPKIKFTIEMDYDENDKIIFPKGIDGNKNIATITIGTKTFTYGLPGLFVAYNKAIEISKDESLTSIIDRQVEMRDQIKESTIRAAAIQNTSDTDDTSDMDDTSDTDKTFINSMKALFSREIADETSDDPTATTTTEKPIVTYVIDSATGEAYGTFIINSSEVTQNVGDMIRSDYLIIDERSNFTFGENIDNERDCLKIQSSEKITDFLILFKNMYY
jgi:hypothetical protein